MIAPSQSVPELRRQAEALKKQPVEQHASLILERLQGSVDDRLVAGYSLAWWALEAPKSASEMATELVSDEVWEVREAATFGVRAALIADAEVLMPLMRAWAAHGDARRHRAFLVAARQPRSQSAEVVDELVSLLATPLSDPDPYVRRNIPFAVRYLARNQMASLGVQLPSWARSGNEGLEEAALAALPFLDVPDWSITRRRVLEDLGRSHHARVRRRVLKDSQG